MSLFKFFFLFTAITGTAFASYDGFKPARFELLVASTSTSAPESLFGHSSLFVIPEDGEWEDGHVFSFVAVTGQEGGLTHLRKGLTGGYPFRVEVTSALNYFNKKIVNEKRDVRRTVLPLTFKQKEKVWAQLLDFQAHPEKLGKYYFHIKNCAAMIYYLFKKSGIQVNYTHLTITSLLSGISPKNLESNLRKVLFNPFPSISASSLDTKIQHLEKLHSMEFKSAYIRKLKKYLPWSDKQFDVIYRMKTADLILISKSIDLGDELRLVPIQNILKDRKRLNLSFIEINSFPDSFYTICDEEDKRCFNKLIKDIHGFYLHDKLKKIVRANILEAMDAMAFFTTEFNYSTSEQSLNWQRIHKELDSQI